MKYLHIKIIIITTLYLYFSFQSYAAAVTWIAGGDGNWSVGANWSGGVAPGVPLTAGTIDDITINCSCKVTNDTGGALVINGSLTISLNSELDMNTQNLEIGKDNGDPDINDATLTVSGTLSNVKDLKAEGDGAVGVGNGSFIINSGTMTAEKVKVGKNSGNGLLTNNVGGVINVIDTHVEALHVDGTVSNSGTINVTQGASFHGGVLNGGGTLNAASIEFEAGKGGPPPAGGGATGGASDIQSQSFSDGAGCSDASDPAPVYIVDGGAGGGPNGDDTYTYQQLLDEFGTVDPGGEFQVDPNNVTSCGEAPAMPITLSDFSAKIHGKSIVKVDWITSSEINNDYFLVDRSIDGIIWENIEIITGAGTSFEVNQYSVVDNQPYKGLSYYKLQQVDYDGTSESFVTSVLINFEAGISVYPNPANDLVVIEGEQMESAIVTVMDLNSKEINIKSEATSHKIFVNTTSLSSGVYYLKINRNGVTETKKLMIK